MRDRQGERGGNRGIHGITTARQNRGTGVARRGRCADDESVLAGDTQIVSGWERGREEEDNAKSNQRVNTHENLGYRGELITSDRGTGIEVVAAGSRSLQ